MLKMVIQSIVVVLIETLAVAWPNDGPSDKLRFGQLGGEFPRSKVEMEGIRRDYGPGPDMASLGPDGAFPGDIRGQGRYGGPGLQSGPGLRTPNSQRFPGGGSEFPSGPRFPGRSGMGSPMDMYRYDGTYDPRSPSEMYDSRGYRIPLPPAYRAPNDKGPNFKNQLSSKLNDLEEILTMTGKWPEFLAELKKDSVRSGGKILPDWEENAYKWSNWIENLVKESETTPPPTTLRPLVRFAASAENPSIGMEPYWEGAGGKKVQEEQLTNFPAQPSHVKFNYHGTRRDNDDTAEEHPSYVNYKAEIQNKFAKYQKQRDHIDALRSKNQKQQQNLKKSSSLKSIPLSKNRPGIKRGPQNAQKQTQKIRRTKNNIGPQKQQNQNTQNFQNDGVSQKWSPLQYQNNQQSYMDQTPQIYQAGSNQNYQNGIRPSYPNNPQSYQNDPPNMQNGNYLDYGPPQQYSNGSPQYQLQTSPQNFQSPNYQRDPSQAINQQPEQHFAGSPQSYYSSGPSYNNQGGPPPDYGGPLTSNVGAPPDYGYPTGHGGPATGNSGPPPDYGGPTVGNSGPPPDYGGPRAGNGGSPPDYGGPTAGNGGSPQDYVGPSPGYDGPPSGHVGTPTSNNQSPPEYGGPSPGYSSQPLRYGESSSSNGGPPYGYSQAHSNNGLPLGFGGQSQGYGINPGEQALEYGGLPSSNSGPPPGYGISSSSSGSPHPGYGSPPLGYDGSSSSYGGPLQGAPSYNGTPSIYGGSPPGYGAEPLRYDGSSLSYSGPLHGAPGYSGSPSGYGVSPPRYAEPPNYSGSPPRVGRPPSGNDGSPAGYDGPPPGYGGSPPSNGPLPGYENLPSKYDGIPPDYHRPESYQQNYASAGSPKEYEQENIPEPDNKPILREQIPLPPPATTPPMPKPTADPLASYNLPATDDFMSPVRWVRFNSIQIKDGLAKVTDPDTGTNRQYTINGTVYVPIPDNTKLGLLEGDPKPRGDLPVATEPPVRRHQDEDKKAASHQGPYGWLEREALKHPGLEYKNNSRCSDHDCAARCNTIGCSSYCSGDSCTSGCLYDNCDAQCYGEGCKAMCVGDMCTAKCSGMSCDARSISDVAGMDIGRRRQNMLIVPKRRLKCNGKDCRAQCTSFDCYTSENYKVSHGDLTFDQVYPEGGHDEHRLNREAHYDDHDRQSMINDHGDNYRDFGGKNKADYKDGLYGTY